MPLPPSPFHLRASLETPFPNHGLEKHFSHKGAVKGFCLGLCDGGPSGRRGHHSAFAVLLMSFRSYCSLLCQPWWSSCPCFLALHHYLCILAGMYVQSCDPADHKAALERVSLPGSLPTLKLVYADHQITDFPSALTAGFTEIPL